MEGTLLPPKLPLRVKLAYSVGHVLNDVCSSLWFSYLLLFFHFALKFDNSLAGVVLLVGQVADGLSTPFIGLEADRTDNFFLCRYGRRKTWHLIGTVCVLVSFPFIFMQCLGCENSSPLAQLVYYSAFVVIFQFGWAAVQVSHLALITDLTQDPNERTEITAYRYAFSVLSNICVYAVTWVILGISVDRTNVTTEDDRIGPEDLVKFRNIVFSVIGVGAINSLFFHIGVKEEQVVPFDIQSEDPARSPLTSYHEAISRRMNWKKWFLEPHFYQVGILYMFTRLFANLTQVYVPLYLQDTLKLQQESIAIIPLVVYLSGFVSSFFMKAVNIVAGRKVTYALGTAFGLSSCVWIYFGSSENFKNLQLYFVAALLGVGSSTMVITSLSFTADLIAKNVETGAFVYGAMSFTDKLANGFAVIVIQNMNPCQHCSDLGSFYYKDILAFVGGGTAILAFLVLLTLIPATIGQRRNSERQLLVPAEGDDDAAAVEPRAAILH